MLGKKLAVFPWDHVFPDERFRRGTHHALVFFFTNVIFFRLRVWPIAGFFLKLFRHKLRYIIIIPWIEIRRSHMQLYYIVDMIVFYDFSHIFPDKPLGLIFQATISCAQKFSFRSQNFDLNPCAASWDENVP